MKKAVYIISAISLILALALAISSCGGKSQNAKLGLKAMNEGDYDRAKRLYTYAVEKGNADAEDKEIYEILCAYTDADRALKSEDFADGLKILDGCKYDYSKLSIKDDMELLRNQLSDGKYSDERIATLESIVEEGNLERARDMVIEISQLILTSNQRARLETISKEVMERISYESPDSYFVYYAKGSPSSKISLYYEPDTSSDVITRIPGGEPIEVREMAENGFVTAIYHGETGYVKTSDIVNGDSQSGSATSDGDKSGEKEDNGKSGESDEPVEKAPVEAISANDTLFAITTINLRDEPNTHCKVIGYIPAGEEVVYLGEMENGFYKVQYNDTVGYAYSDYLQSN